MSLPIARWAVVGYGSASPLSLTSLQQHLPRPAAYDTLPLLSAPPT
jgi:hypothetical protein